LHRASEKEECVSFLEAWQDFETQNGDDESLENLMPKIQRVKAGDGMSLFAFFLYKRHQIRIPGMMKQGCKSTQ
jgi:hypothetical protein